MKKEISFTEIEKITGGDATVMKQLLEIFVNENTRNIQRLEESYASANWDELKRAAHKVKSSLALVGLTHHREVAETLEKTAGENSEDTKKQTDQLLDACKNAIAEVKLKLQKIS